MERPESNFEIFLRKQGNWNVGTDWKPFIHPAIVFKAFGHERFGRKEDSMLQEGSKAPDFSVEDDRGNIQKLNDYAGKKSVVLFFYPKADTPG
jgi:hypothetical protein